MIPAGTWKSAMDVRDHVVKFSDNDDGIFIAISAGEAAWRVEGSGWGVIFGGILDVLPVW